MGKTAIEWTGSTWNPVVGCSVVSPGCTNCYAMEQAARITRMNPGSHYVGTVQPSKAGPVWTGRMALAPDSIFEAPLRKTKPETWFVNSMGDLFHESVRDEWIDRVFAVMAMCPQHTFQILTKRAARMRAYIEAKRRQAPEWLDLPSLGARVLLPYEGGWPTNVWLGVSAEDQQRADERIPFLLATPAAVRFVSAEPLLGPIDFTNLGGPGSAKSYGHHGISAIWPGGHVRPCLDWIIVGGESGPGARPMHPDWARQIQEDCRAAEVAFFMNQMGGPVKARMPEIPAELLVREMPRTAA